MSTGLDPSRVASEGLDEPDDVPQIERAVIRVGYGVVGAYFALSCLPIEDELRYLFFVETLPLTIWFAGAIFILTLIAFKATASASQASSPGLVRLRDRLASCARNLGLIAFATASAITGISFFDESIAILLVFSLCIISSVLAISFFGYLLIMQRRP